MPVKKVCVITGGTSGIGLCTAQAMLEKGYTVYELSRRAEGAPGMKHIMADVTKEETLAAAVQEILTQEDHIDVLINNAGFGISGAVEFTKTEDAQHQLDVNFFGMVRMNRQVLPVMRRQCHGRIVNLSSVAGAIPIPFQTYYSASKAAINSYTMALANEVKPFGIQVCCVQPGDIRTGFTAAREKNPEGGRRLRRAHRALCRGHGARRAERHGPGKGGRIYCARRGQKERPAHQYHRPAIQILLLPRQNPPGQNAELAGRTDLRKIKTKYIKKRFGTRKMPEAFLILQKSPAGGPAGEKLQKLITPRCSSKIFRPIRIRMMPPASSAFAL